MGAQEVVDKDFGELVDLGRWEFAVGVGALIVLTVIGDLDRGDLPSMASWGLS